MTDERRPIRQNSGNLKKFQAGISKLMNVTVKVSIHEALVEGRIGNWSRDDILLLFAYAVGHYQGARFRGFQ